MKSSYVVIISWTGAGVLHSMSQALNLKCFFPNPEFDEFENYEEACRWAEEALAERYPENVYRRQDLRDYKDIYCFILREETSAEGGQRNAG